MARSEIAFLTARFLLIVFTRLPTTVNDEATAATAEIGNTRVSREGANIRSAHKQNKHEIRHRERLVPCSGTPCEVSRKLDDRSGFQDRSRCRN